MSADVSVPGAALVRLTMPGGDACAELLCAEVTATGAGCAVECADVLAAGDARSFARAEDRCREVLARFPGCLLAWAACGEAGLLAVARGGGVVTVRPWSSGDALERHHRVAVVAFLHGWLVLRRHFDGLREVCVRSRDGDAAGVTVTVAAVAGPRPGLRPRG